MSIAKKGARKITVGGTTYLWRIRQKPTYDQDMGWTNMAVAIQRGTENGSTLIVVTPFLRSTLSKSMHGSVTPADVESYIRTALARGWDPLEGAAFELDMRII
jgi:hypothetical protein